MGADRCGKISTGLSALEKPPQFSQQILPQCKLVYTYMQLLVRRAETNLGDLCADACLDQSGADIAFLSGGCVRVDIARGDITVKDILSVHPFGSMLTVIEVTGQQVLDALEWGCRAVPEESGAFPQVAGMTFEIHTYIKSSCTQDEDGMTDAQCI